MKFVWPVLAFVVGLHIGKQPQQRSGPATIGQVRGNTNAIAEQEQATETATASGCLEALPKWARDGHAESLSEAFKTGSNGLTDKSTRHNYQIMYHRYLSPMVLRLCLSEPHQKPRFRMLEIGLGCGPGGGMLNGEPGGSTRAWRHLFPPDIFDLDLHVMEYDAACAHKWEAENPGIATKVHAGDASSATDLDRVLRDSGGQPFDMILDDASHLNEHQIATFEHMIPHVAKGGIYVIEDTISACSSWAANTGTDSANNGLVVKGTKGCMETKDGKPTIFSKLVGWQKPLLTRKAPFPDVTSIDIQFEAAVISKQY